MEAEIKSYLTEFNILRKEIGNTINGLSTEEANWHPLPEGTNSIYAVLTHIMGADNRWVHQVMEGKSIQRDRDSEFRASGNFTDLLNRWEQHWTEITSVLEKLNSSQLSEVRPVTPQPDRESSVSLRWIILHLISHYATHLGHIQLTRQLWEQQRR